MPISSMKPFLPHYNNIMHYVFDTLFDNFNRPNLMNVFLIVLFSYSENVKGEKDSCLAM